MKTVRLKKSGKLKRLSDAMAQLFVKNGAGTYAPKQQWKSEVRDLHKSEKT